MTTRSPPVEPEEFRGQTLTPVSPKPIHYPAPANIPVLEKQMDPVFNDTATHYPPDDAQHDQQDKQSTHSSADSLYADQPAAEPLREPPPQQDDEYARSLAFEDGEGADNQDTSKIQNFAHSSSVPADAPSDAAQPPYTSQPYAPPNGNDGGVDFQALLDNLANASAPADQNAQAQANPSQVPAPSVQTSALPGNPNLPPRPPPQEKPATHPNYTPGDDIRSYHPHSQKNPAASYRAQPGLPPLMTQGQAPGAAGAPLSQPGYQQTPVSAMSQRTASPATPSYRQRDSVDRRPDRDQVDDSDVPWGPDVQKLYDAFLQDERVYVTEGQWDKFPSNSRLFIGNLPTEKVTKRDLFHIFHRHGKLAQISIKQAYGFVQFLDAGACLRALQSEQGQVVRGRKMHLEISKPQRNTRKEDDKTQRSDRNGARRRSRSPDYTRGASASAPRNVDRYTGASSASPRRDEFRRSRDDYRPGRSPSPRGYRRGGRDRSRDRYDGRRRSRSRSPYGRGGRYRSPTPRHDPDDELTLPRRHPNEVPDVQILVLQPGEVDRHFIAWVEQTFQENGVRADVLLLSPRLNEAAVVRRQILEGVHAVSRMTRLCQQTGHIPLQVFNRSAGQSNVTFEEYDNLDVRVCAQLILRAKEQSMPAPTPTYPTTYGMPPPSYGIPSVPAPAASYGMPVQPAAPPAALPGAGPDLSSLIHNLDSNGLQKLLAGISQQQPAAPQQQPPSTVLTPGSTGMTPDLARLFGGGGASGPPPPAAIATQQQQQPTGYPPQQTWQQPGGPVSPFGPLQGNPALAGFMPPQQQGHQQPTSQQIPFTQSQQQPQPGAVPPPAGNMQEIMAQLAKYRR
ncbi:rna-binding protein [Diplodia corticola]|uniref:Rna-binding protein n=1 Tax=Diplodia corticola TaxID=236234 RepID=A0A1J9R3A8_9PEZI|nr:rna-binding protein [Diplodia corticola]OJD34714.1 rna-binding protein [Diplodia corticola]